MVLVLRRFDLQPNIRERNSVVKRDPTVLGEKCAPAIPCPLQRSHME